MLFWDAKQHSSLPGKAQGYNSCLTTPHWWQSILLNYAEVSFRELCYYHINRIWYCGHGLAIPPDLEAMVPDVLLNPGKAVMLPSGFGEFTGWAVHWTSTEDNTRTNLELVYQVDLDLGEFRLNVDSFWLDLIGKCSPTQKPFIFHAFSWPQLIHSELMDSHMDVNSPCICTTEASYPSS